MKYNFLLFVFGHAIVDLYINTLVHNIFEFNVPAARKKVILCRLLTKTKRHFSPNNLCTFVCNKNKLPCATFMC